MTRIERLWHSRNPAAAALLPISLLFAAVAGLRRTLYARGWLRRTRLPVPVIVVGNITVGGTGKTPLVLALVRLLQEHGYRPGIVTRGYGGTARGPEAISENSDPARCGDEAVLLAMRSGAPVWIGRDRSAAARALLAADPGCNIIVSDDGLQHYGLQRDIELAVVDASRGYGNGWLLPAGPLREPVARLEEIDAIVVNGTGSIALPAGIASYRMSLAGDTFYALARPAQRVSAEHFRSRSLHAIAGIGHPERFFAHLEALGLSFRGHAFPDHHAYRPEDLRIDGADAILMTEKDAVKCRSFTTERCWVLPVDAAIDPAFGQLLLRKLGSR
jgi:tetraacyldisaccharide 4'-kinase